MKLTNVRSIFLRGCGVDWSILRALGQPFSFLKEKRKASGGKEKREWVAMQPINPFLREPETPIQIRAAPFLNCEQSEQFKNTRNFALAKFRSIYKNAEHFCRE